MVAKVEKATSPQTVRVALELDVPRTRPSSAASTRTTMSPQKQLRPQSASPALTRVQQQRHQVLGWRAYVADPRIFNDAAIGAKARAANSVPALWQASLRRVDVRSILKKESNIAPYSDYAMLEPRPMGVGQLRCPAAGGILPPYALHNTTSATNAMVMDAAGCRPMQRPASAPLPHKHPLCETDILGMPMRERSEAARVVWSMELGGWVKPQALAQHRALKQSRSSPGFGGPQTLPASGASNYERRAQLSSKKWMDWGGGESIDSDDQVALPSSGANVERHELIKGVITVGGAPVWRAGVILRQPEPEGEQAAPEHLGADVRAPQPLGTVLTLHKTHNERNAQLVRRRRDLVARRVQQGEHSPVRGEHTVKPKTRANLESMGH